MKDYEIIVGLEVHAELSTETKIYCSCKNKFGSEVNTNCCPVCMGLPGAIPTLNKQVVEYAIKMGLATNCTINKINKMDRKNYYYPDLPKAYQISQFDVPICENGHLNVLIDEEGNTKTIGITRIHMEEDAGKLIHDDSFNETLVDFNRAGVPLIEIVSEPDIRSGAEARAYLNTIKSILSYLKISDCKMQEGSIRCDVNVSVREKGQDILNTRVEMKNINTFSGVERAIEYEAQRQIELIENGGTIEQETRRWDDVKGENKVLRSKMEANDYLFFPDPDLMTIVVPQEQVDNIKQSLPELPNKKLIRYMNDYKLPHFDANLITESVEKAKFFEDCLKVSKCQPKNIANWLLGEITRILNETKAIIETTNLTPKKLTDMVKMIENKEISNAAGKEIINDIIFNDKSVKELVEEKGLAQISDDSALVEVVNTVLSNNEKAVEDFKNGKTNVLGFLVGQCMKATKGKGNPAKLREIMEQEINKR